jgi:hypothetical protein
VERGSNQVGPRLDDELKHETEGMVRSGHSTHAEEWKDPEPSGEDQPEVDMAPDGTLQGGTPDGMSDADVEHRSRIAAALGRAPYPAVREQLIGLAVDHHAPDALVDELRRLPSGRTFASVNDVVEALGWHVEQHRF